MAAASVDEWSDWEEFEIDTEENKSSSEGEDSEGDYSEDLDDGDTTLEVKKTELLSVLHLLDTEKPDFNFQPVQNHNHLIPAFDSSNVGPQHDLPLTATPLQYFQLYYTDSFLQQV
jgi:hypothetical protein